MKTVTIEQFHEAIRRQKDYIGGNTDATTDTKT